MWDTKIKNTAFWFGDHNARARFFPNTWLWQKVIRPSVLSHSSKTSTFICIIFLSELQKLHCGGIFGTFWASLTRLEFFQKSGSVSFLKLWLSNFKHKIKRHWWAVFEIFPWEWTEQTKERTNKRKASQIHWTLLLALVSNYLETQNGLSSMHFFLHFLFSWSNVAFFTLHAKQKSIYKW